MSNVSNDGTRGSSINTTEKTSTNTISASIWVGKDSGGGNSSNLISSTPLSLFSNSLFRGSGGSSSSSILSSVFNSNWEREVKNWSSKGCGSGSNRGNGKVGSGNSESVNRISNVVDSLQKTVGINVLVGAG